MMRKKLLSLICVLGLVLSAVIFSTQPVYADGFDKPNTDEQIVTRP